jgi:hypothetical protein
MDNLVVEAWLERTLPTRRSEVHVHRIFSLPLARRAPGNGSPISLSGNLHPQITSRNSPLILQEIELHSFANPVVKHLVSQSPKLENNQHLTFLSLFQISPYRDFGSCDVKQLVSSIPETRITKTSMCSQG